MRYFFILFLSKRWREDVEKEEREYTHLP
jgi:hypothetical protein